MILADLIKSVEYKQFIAAIREYNKTNCSELNGYKVKKSGNQLKLHTMLHTYTRSVRDCVKAWVDGIADDVDRGKQINS